MFTSLDKSSYLQEKARLILWLTFSGQLIILEIHVAGYVELSSRKKPFYRSNCSVDGRNISKWRGFEG